MATNDNRQIIRLKIKSSFEDMCKKVANMGGDLRGNSTQLEEYYDNETNSLAKQGYELCLTQRDPFEEDRRRITIWMLKLMKGKQLQASILTNPQITDILYVLGYFPNTVLQRHMKTYRFATYTEIRVSSLPHYGTILTLIGKNIYAIKKAAQKIDVNITKTLKKTDKQLAQEYCKKFSKEMLGWE